MLSEPVVLLLLLIFTTGVSYAVSIWFVFQRDAGNIYSNFIFILRFFVAMFYSVDWVAAGVRWVIEHNPVYLYIYILRLQLSVQGSTHVFLWLSVSLFCSYLLLLRPYFFRLCFLFDYFRLYQYRFIACYGLMKSSRKYKIFRYPYRNNTRNHITAFYINGNP